MTNSRFNRKTCFLIKLPEGMVQKGDGRVIPIREFIKNRFLVIDGCSAKPIGKINLLDLLRKYGD